MECDVLLVGVLREPHRRGCGMMLGFPTGAVKKCAERRRIP